MKKLILIIALTHAAPFHGQESYRLPTNELPITYLNNLEIDDPSRNLSSEERAQLVRLLVNSFIVSVRKYKQDYLLHTSTPVYQLLRTNFPSIAERVGEGGIFLGSITRFFNRLDEYKPIVSQLLRADSGRGKQCQE